MDEIREVAKAYYAAATAAEKDLAVDYFRSLDANGDGRISLAEYKELVSPWYSNDRLFMELDRNGDGTLDFEELLALFYSQKIPNRWCDACSNILLGPYFSCLLCEKEFPNSCDLCCRCYGGGEYQHHHPRPSFVDNRSLRVLLTEFMKQSQVTVPDNDDQVMMQNVDRSISRSNRGTSMDMFHALSTGLSVGNAMVSIGNFVFNSGCSIM